MRAIVLAGGLGTRLRSVVPNLPKSMAPVAGSPFLEVLLNYLHGQGVEEVMLAVGYKYEIIVRHFAGAYRGMRIRYSIEDSPLGTGGALSKALQILGGAEAVLAVNGDTIFEVPLQAMVEFHRRKQAKVTLAVKQVSDRGRYGVVGTDGDRVISMDNASDSAGLINGGVFVLDIETFSNCRLNVPFNFESDFLAKRLPLLRVMAFQCDGFFLDLGVPEDFGRAQAELGRYLNP